ncbi:MAG TPA: GDP-mannose 4,6-dehydratase [Nitrospiraceae bacterium]
MKTTLITGVTGQDGPYLSKYLLGRDCVVYGGIRDSACPNLKNLRTLGIEKDVRLVPMNLLDLSHTIRVLERLRPDQVYNLAAQSSVSLSFEQPFGTFQFNILSALNLLEAIRILRLKTKFYQASSSEMYGRTAELPVREQTRVHPVSPYGISKASAHWTTVHYREAYGLFCCCGILFNHESFLRGEHFVTKKIVSTAARISRGSKEKLRLGNIEIRRDWGYAPEYAKTMPLILEQEEADDYVIASGEVHSLRDFIECAFASLGLHWREHVLIDKNLYRPAEINVIYGDPAKARTRLRWKYDMTFPQLVRLLVQEEISNMADK